MSDENANVGETAESTENTDTSGWQDDGNNG